MSVWQMDDISAQPDNYTMEKNICERHFLDNVSQNSQGSKSVKLPIKEQMLNNIGDSRESALKRLRGIERRFKRDLTFKIQYAAFLDEYLSLEHMRRIEPPIAEETISFYLPHHCVFTVGQASKIHIVFDASCRSSSGVSLNALLILVHPSQQRILSDDLSANVDTYELTTVTYGTASASFLATRCFKHLAEQYTHQFTRGSACVLWDFYVDDMVTEYSRQIKTNSR
ncbi:PREDICTED: uncharacterized protein LOC108695146 [Atta colombica]|uniref:uncharacterized protein LOC108695146 n=1 Tax=Atta colombica TaxID=520822 RepID=UPI00084BC91D|nr:PREDICTED: uncharacterized protein LOC108695146 [Atta colombica]